MLTMNCYDANMLAFDRIFEGMPCKRIEEPFRVDFRTIKGFLIAYDYGNEGDYVVNDAGRLEIFTKEQVEQA